MPPEYFLVRWTGWLVPLTTGRCILHAAIDNGMRVWLDDKLVLDEWRPQSGRHFTVAVPLQRGRAYRLRAGYFQDILDTSSRLAWKRPATALAPPRSSWRNLWGCAATHRGRLPLPRCPRRGS